MDERPDHVGKNVKGTPAIGCQIIDATVDPLEPTVDIALKNTWCLVNSRLDLYGSGFARPVPLEEPGTSQRILSICCFW